MSLFDWFADRQKKAPVVRSSQGPEPDEGDGLWSKCPECDLVVYRKDLVLNAHVCKGCGHHHRIDSDQRIRLIADEGSFEALDADQRELYLSMVGSDGWCIHFDTGGRRCRIYDQRPDFCRVENLMSLFGSPNQGEAALEVQAANELAISCCKQQIRSEYGGRGRVMRRFLRAIRQQP